MTETFHSLEDSTREGLFQLWLEAPQDSHLRTEIWDFLVEMDRKQTKEQLSILRDELNNLNGTNTKAIQTQTTE